MASSNDFFNGMTINYDDEILEVVEFMHVKPGKGPAFVRTKVRNLRTGSLYEKTFRGGEKVDQIRLDDKQMQYLYREADNFVFMDNETYEQIELPSTQLGDKVDFLKENETINVLFNGSEILGVKLPQFMELTVVESEPGVKGNTVSGGSKPAKVETGAIVRVPLFINVGDKIKVDTTERKYLERVKG